MSDSLSKNNLTDATTELRSSMALFKTGSVNHNTARKLARLYGEGFIAIQRIVPPLTEKQAMSISVTSIQNPTKLSL